jgi:hypothetical protein
VPALCVSWIFDDGAGCWTTVYRNSTIVRTATLIAQLENSTSTATTPPGPPPPLSHTPALVLSSVALVLGAVALVLSAVTLVLSVALVLSAVAIVLSCACA